MPWQYRTISNRFSNFSTVTYFNTKIRAAVKEASFFKALVLFHQMKQTGLQPNNLTFPFLAKACALLSNLINSQIIHAHVVKSPHYFDIYVQTAMIDMYAKCNQTDDALELFENMPERDVPVWNAILLGFIQAGSLDRVQFLFLRMMLDGIRPDAVTVMGLAQFASSVKDVRLLEGVHCLTVKVGLESDNAVDNTWIAACAKCGNLRMAEKVFDGIECDSLTVISWNSMIAGYAYFGEGFRAMGVYKRMSHGGFRPDLSTILNLLGSFSKPEALFQGKLIHCHGVRLGCDSDVAMLNTLISMYCRCGDIFSARSLFNSLGKRTRVSWTAMIGGYAEKGDLEEAMTLFHAMKAAGEEPDLVTLLHLISACGHIGALDAGRWIDKYALSRGLTSDVMLCNALLDMYGKCGNIRDAEELFTSMTERTVVSWTTKIAGYALNGKSKEALICFSKMLDSAFKPNHITFLAVLQSCVHAGLIEKGWEYFNFMTKNYKINASLDHYSCMADLLGRQGKLVEAIEFIQNMPVKPDAGIWGALLSACKNHRNADIGEFAACRLFELEPETAAPYVGLANIYASSDRWDDFASIRAKMKCKVRKYPGESIIHVDGKSYTFRVEDRFHHESYLVYEIISVLVLHFKDELKALSPDDCLNFVATFK